MMHEVLDFGAAAVVDRLLKRIEHEVGCQRRGETRHPSMCRAKTSITNVT